MQKTTFTKMNGAGNDFVLLDNRRGQAHLDAAAIARICDRHRGIGADGVLAVEPAEGADADFRMRYYNSDGGEAEMCGNGARCFARFAGRLAERALESIRFETPAGVVGAHFEGERVRISMTAPRDLRMDETVEAHGRSWTIHSVDTGVPHAVIFVDEPGDLDVGAIGAALRYHPHFAPRGTNVNFACVTAPGRLILRTYERGVEAETLACGTGAVATGLIYSALYDADGPIDITVRGGEDLRIGFTRENGDFKDVTLSGPADFVFTGEIEL